MPSAHTSQHSVVFNILPCLIQQPPKLASDLLHPLIRKPVHNLPHLGHELFRLFEHPACHAPVDFHIHGRCHVILFVHPLALGQFDYVLQSFLLKELV